MTAIRDYETRRSIPTVYGITRFRSKLEADWARFFDVIGLEWEYEREGRYFGDVFYLPDFYLPKSRQYIEVKGVFQPDDVRKIRALLNHLPSRPFTGDDTPDIPLVACVPDGHFYGWRRGKDTTDWFSFVTKAAVSVQLWQCSRCKGWWFVFEPDGWNCQCCGEAGGNSHILDQITSPLPAFPNLSRFKDLREE